MTSLTRPAVAQAHDAHLLAVEVVQNSSRSLARFQLAVDHRQLLAPLERLGGTRLALIPSSGPADP